MTDTTAGAGERPLREHLIEIARSIEALKRECGMDPETPTAIHNGQLMSVSYRVRALAAALNAKPDLRGVDAGPISEWLDLMRHGQVSKDEVLIMAKDAVKVASAALPAAQESALADRPSALMQEFANAVYREARQDTK